ncbi:MAG: hypothetical protein ACKON7_06960 [Planctomycetaceae bacterium]
MSVLPPTSADPTNDTAADAEAVLIECLRRLTPLERLQKGCAMSRRAKLQAIAALRRRHPDADDEALRLRYSALAYGREIAAGARRWLQDHSG